MSKLEEMTIEAIKHCKTCHCDGCPFKGRASYCMSVLEYLINKRVEREKKNKQCCDSFIEETDGT